MKNFIRILVRQLNIGVLNFNLIIKNRENDLYNYQSNVDLKTFAVKLELAQNKTFDNNPFLVFELGDFQAKWDQWYKNNNTTHKGFKIAHLTSIWAETNCKPVYSHSQ